MSSKKTYIIGAGFTGLGAGILSKSKIFEATSSAGGICASYEREGFHFEIGGGHWIFGGDPYVLNLVDSISQCKRYSRKSAVFFAGNLDATKPYAKTFVDYPIQNNLFGLGEKASGAILQQLIASSKSADIPATMEEWLKINFGELLCDIFFRPFHEKYTAGLYKEIAPQDAYKSPLSIRDVVDGAFRKPNTDVGYNVSYLYPHEGLDTLAKKLGAHCNVDYEVALEKIDPSTRTLKLSDGRELEFDQLISTMPLNKIVEVSGLQRSTQPYTSVMVLNMGVRLADSALARHGNHWLYIPDSLAGFHRVGYYSNVDPLFLPERFRDPEKYGSLYIEFAFKNGEKPSPARIETLCQNTSDELKEWGLINDVLIIDPTWIDVAYTWQKPKSSWVKDSIKQLAQHGIVSSGRYGGWNFQGIAESMKEGLVIGSTMSLGKDFRPQK